MNKWLENELPLSDKPVQFKVTKIYLKQQQVKIFKYFLKKEREF
jgi:hypothetical protein